MFGPPGGALIVAGVVRDEVRHRQQERRVGRDNAPRSPNLTVIELGLLQLAQQRLTSPMLSIRHEPDDLIVWVLGILPVGVVEPEPRADPDTFVLRRRAHRSTASDGLAPSGSSVTASETGGCAPPMMTSSMFAPAAMAARSCSSSSQTEPIAGLP